VGELSVSVLTPVEAEGALYPLSRLLEDAVADGASVGFIHPMEKGQSLAYWKSVLPSLRDGSKLLFAAKNGGVLIGTAQLQLEPRPNGLHRAEVSKLMVLSSARRRGIGRTLMQAVEAEAFRLGRTTLILDTREGDPSETLYRALGWQLAGIIPGYARSSNGHLDAAAIYYKLLD
jgi:ribosomal protein S18 acetylase RimI-like enzyme